MKYFLEEAPAAAKKLDIGRFVRSSQHAHWLQHPVWVEISGRTREGQYLYFWGEEGGQIQVSALVRRMRLPVLGWAKDSVERGPACDSVAVMAEALPHLAQMLKARGSVSLTVNPCWFDSEAEQMENLLTNVGFCQIERTSGPHSVSLVIDLTQDEEDIFRNFSKNTRKAIRKAGRLGIEVTPAKGEDDIVAFYRLYRDSAQALGLKPLVRDYLLRLWRLLLSEEEDGICLMARYQGELVSAEIVLKHGVRVEDTYGPSLLKKWPEVPKNHLCVWHAVQWAKEQGCQAYDLGGVMVDAEQDSQIAGVNRYKLGFSDRQVRLVREHEKVFHPVQLHLLSTVASIRGRMLPTG